MTKVENGSAVSRVQEPDRCTTAITPRGAFLTRVRRIAVGPDTRLQVALLAFMLFWYGTLLHFSPVPSFLAPLDLTFNSMLVSLLHGRFDVDPHTVTFEGFLRNGHVYAYWGIWCALLRLPLWIFRRMNLDMTAWSCLTAVCLAAMVKVRAVLLLRRCGERDPTARSAAGLMLAYVVLGGSEIGYLRVSIYQEVVFWAAAFAAVFVYFAIKGLVSSQFDLATLSAMALCAGLALLTRVSTGIGLILAIVLLLFVLAARSSAHEAGGGWPAIRRAMRVFTSRRILLPLGIIAVCIAATCTVNYFRWGNPLTFANLKLYIFNREYPDRLARESMYGMFNPIRIPYGLVYYFFPIWTVKTGSAHLLFDATQTRLFDVVELPPSSFLLTDLLPLCFILFLLTTLRRRHSRNLPPVAQWAAIATGLLAPCVLMLTAISMTYRYRMEFYPEIDFLAFLGLYVILTDETIRVKFARYRVWMEMALIVSVAASFAALILYWMAPFGSAQWLLHRGALHGKYFIF